jgi:enoyl-CoA hydratase/carnithine racemase
MIDLRWVRLEKTEDGIRVLTLDRPPINALGFELVEDLARAVDRVRKDEAARCLIVRSSQRHFCAGADLKERQAMSLDEVRSFVTMLSSAVASVATLPIPSIAAVRGAAVGGGCELALACDLRVVAEDATMGLRETALAILPGAGGTQRLARIAGLARAKRWIFTAKAFSAAEALADGVADKVVAAERLDAEARRLAETISANGPIAVRQAKKAIEGGFDLPIAEALAHEWECYQAVLTTEDRNEALRAFSEHRPPRFEGR